MGGRMFSRPLQFRTLVPKMVHAKNGDDRTVSSKALGIHSSWAALGGWALQTPGYGRPLGGDRPHQWLALVTMGPHTNKAVQRTPATLGPRLVDRVEFLRNIKEIHSQPKNYHKYSNHILYSQHL